MDFLILRDARCARPQDEEIQGYFGRPHPEEPPLSWAKGRRLEGRGRFLRFLSPEAE